MFNTEPAYAKSKTIKVKSISFNNVNKIKVLKKGSKFRLKYSVNAGSRKSWIRFKTSNKKIATVSSKGLVKAKKKGSCTITAYSKKNKKVKQKVTIKVGTPITKLTLYSPTNIYVGDTYSLGLTYYPSNATYKNAALTSSNTNVVTINESGGITAKSAGTVTITAIANDGSGVSTKRTITVSPITVNSSDALFIAHRGLSRYAPENTLASFKLASEYEGFYGIEFDVYESLTEIAPTAEDVDNAWNPLILTMHDSNTYRMCNVDSNIQTINRSNLSQYIITGGNNIDEFPNQQIPTIEESLNCIWDNSATAIPVIEIKHRLSPGALSYMMDYIGDHKVCIISFDFATVDDAKAYAELHGRGTNVSTMYLLDALAAGEYDSLIDRMHRNHIDTISISYKHVSPQLVDAFHAANLRVGTWTLPNTYTVRKNIDMGVDFITANEAFFE